MPLDKYYLCAEIVPLERDSYWHARLATMLLYTEHVDSAMKELLIAINIDPLDWLPYSVLAECYCIRGNHLAAIQWQRKSLTLIPRAQKTNRVNVLTNISNSSRVIGDFTTALEVSEEAFKLFPTDIRAYCEHIEALDAASRYEDIWQLLVILEESASETPGQSMLTQMLLYGDSYEILSNAVHALGRSDFLIIATRKAVAAAEARKSWDEGLEQRCNLALLHLMRADQPDEAMNLWEGILESKTEENCPLWIALVVFRTTKKHLSQLYYNKATDAESSGLNPDEWVKKL